MPQATTARDAYHGRLNAAVGEPIHEGEQHPLIDVERGVGPRGNGFGASRVGRACPIDEPRTGT